MSWTPLTPATVVTWRTLVDARSSKGNFHAIHGKLVVQSGPLHIGTLPTSPSSTAKDETKFATTSAVIDAFSSDQMAEFCSK